MKKNIRNAEGKIAREIKALAMSDYPDGSPDADFERFYHFGHMFRSYRFNTTAWLGKLWTKEELITSLAECVALDGLECEGLYGFLEERFASWTALEVKLHMTGKVQGLSMFKWLKTAKVTREVVKKVQAIFLPVFTE